MKSECIEEFKNPGCEYRGAPFWAWNGKLEPEELRLQVRLMKEMGLGGFFMHSRTGLETEYLGDKWFGCVEACIDEAEKLDMKAWLYDEDRWPSGSGGGLVTRNPEYRSRLLVLEELDSFADLNLTEDSLAVFKGKVDGNKLGEATLLDTDNLPEKTAEDDKVLHFYTKSADVSDWFNGQTYLDTLNHDAVKEFIRLTHEKYKDRFGEYFGERVPGFFTDEPNFPNVCEEHAENTFSVPWTKQLPSVFKDRYGYDIIQHLPDLFYYIETEKAPETKFHYMDCVTSLFTDAFAKQIGEWCEENNILHTGHVLEEDTLHRQTARVGSCMRFYEYMQAPGMDLLTEHCKSYDTAKQVSSVARQFGRKWRLSETYGGTGWDFSMEGHKAVSDWQAALGINLRCQHLAWYTMRGEAKRDYPASIFYQSPWYRNYPGVEDYFARINLILSRGKEIRDVLLIHSNESMWLKIAKGWKDARSTHDFNQEFIDAGNLLLQNHFDFDYGDEDILARHGSVVRGEKESMFRIKEAAYTTVVLANMHTIRSSTIKLLEQFVNAGGNVVFYGDPPFLVDARPSECALALAEKTVRSSSEEEWIAHLEKTARRVSICDGNGEELQSTLYQLREDSEGYYIFICNTGHDEKQLAAAFEETDPSFVRDRVTEYPQVYLKIRGGFSASPLELDLPTGQIYKAEAESKGSFLEIKTALSPVGSRMFFIPKREAENTYPCREDLETLSRDPIQVDHWDIELSEPNVLALDSPRYRISADGKWNEAKDILYVDRAVRDCLGITYRGGAMLQPWAKKKKETPRSVPVELEYSFNVDYIPETDVHLAIECPEIFSIFLNEIEIDACGSSEWWVDRSLKKIKIPRGVIAKGANLLRLECDYSEEFSGIEIVYILGDFGVKLAEGVPLVQHPVESLKIGDWCSQGLPFYSGAVSYKCTINYLFHAGERYFLNIPEYRGSLINVRVNGATAGAMLWRPNELEITNFMKGAESLLEIEVISHRRNSHGPLHYGEKWPRRTGPEQYLAENQSWQDEYQFVPCGMMKPPEVTVKK